MKWIILSMLLLRMIPAMALQQDSTQTVSLITYLANGESLNYAVVKTRIDSSNTKEPKTTENKFNFKITVTDSTDTSYRFVYYRSADFLTKDQFTDLPQEVAQKIMSLSQLKIEYETNEVGAFKQILNEDEILDKIKSDFDELRTLVQSPEGDDRLANIIDELIASMDPKMMISLYSQDILALHFALGLTFDLQDTIAYEEEIIAPFINVPIKTSGIFYCDEYDPENDYISFIEEKVIDGNFKEKIISFLQKYENKDNPIPVEEFKNMEMEIYVTNNYQYNSRFGVPVYVELYKVVTVDHKEESLKRIEQYTITIAD